MRRLARPITYTVAALVALLAFIQLRAATPTPLAWSQPAAWMDKAEGLDAVVEIARWLGIALAGYVAVIGLLATVAETALAVRAVPVARAINRVASIMAFPALRRRLLDVSTAAAITAAAVNVAASAAPAATVPVTVIVDTSSSSDSFTLPSSLDPSMFAGFGYDTSAPANTELAASPDGNGSVVVTVQAGDTLWDLATAHYGFCDQSLLDVIQNANSELTDPGLIHRGQLIALPALFAEAPAPAPTVPATEATWSVYVVQAGDTLWDILDTYYGHVDADLVWRIAEVNGLADPSDITIGTALTLPPLTESSPDLPTPTTSTDAEVADPEDPTVVTPVADAPAPAPADEAAAPTTAAPRMETTTPPATPAVFPAKPASTGEKRMESLATRIGWQGPAALAAGLIALAGLLRRERRPRRHRPPTEPVRDTDLVLRTAPLATNIEWAAETLRGVAFQLRPRPGTACPAPLCVQIDNDGLELLWDLPRPQLADGWTTPNDGRTWHRTRDQDPEVATVAAPCPALVTIGRHGPTEILLNLELGGVVSLVGDRSRALDLARSICFELGTTPFKDVTNSLLCAFPLDGIEHLEWVRSVDIDEAIGWLTERRDSARAHLAHRRLPALFALRAAHSQHDPHSPVVVIVDAERSASGDIDRLVRAADSNAGAIVIVIGNGPAGAWTITSEPGMVTIEPLGLTLDPVGVSADISGRIATLLDDAAGDSLTTEDADEAPSPTDTNEPVDSPAGEANGEATAEEGPASLAPMAELKAVATEPAVVFRILGPIRVDGLTERLRPIELELGVYLALHRHGQTADTIRTMLWPNGSADKTWRNVSSALRTKLGVDPDGGPRLTTRGHLGRYQLAPTVTTDLDIFMATWADITQIDAADLASLARQEFGRIRGPLFSDVSNGYSWAFSDGTVSQVESEILRIATVVMAALGEAGLDSDRSWIASRLEVLGLTESVTK